MKCELKYRPVVAGTNEEDRRAILSSYVSGDGSCPVCKRVGKTSLIEERFGESTCEVDGTYAVCLDENDNPVHGASMDD
ncbi:hypothetical protein MNBD_NITROSPINAE02-1306 [hydrothermal vent metagenome]|uniref:Uncharacterized protein n=1 Tax=hydrothermal vent metagenome TaxID=652676 RepID=A0A3B1BT22_9ZZZZ